MSKANIVTEPEETLQAIFQKIVAQRSLPPNPELYLFRVYSSGYASYDSVFIFPPTDPNQRFIRLKNCWSIRINQT